jgi:ABC-type glycerol-3-phosphate transport system permease component
MDKPYTQLNQLAQTSVPKKKITAIEVVTGIVKYTIIVLLSVSFILPLYWMAMSALKIPEQVFVIPPIWFPNPARWVNYIEAWQVDEFSLYLFNTVFRYCIPVVIGTVVSNTLVAYSFGRLKWPGRDVLFAICMMTMMIPGQVTMVPVFIIFKHLGWINNFKISNSPFFASAYNIFCAVFRTSPKNYRLGT